MEPIFSTESFGSNNQEILCEGYDADSGANLVVMSCPNGTIDGNGPVFESLDSETVYILISEEYVSAATASATDLKSTYLQYGMMLGDIMRRGSYYAQNINNNNNNK